MPDRETERRDGSAEVGPDGLARCPWALTAPDYTAYHDTEWGHERHGDDAMFERLSLEIFQAGLSWLTILRKREAFRAAFADFSIEKVAAFEEPDVERLLGDAGIVRNRAKIEAVIHNARIALRFPEGLSAHLWFFAPTRPRRRPVRLADVPAGIDESAALAHDLSTRHGFRRVGEITVYSTMQATGMVDDHLTGCQTRPGHP